MAAFEYPVFLETAKDESLIGAGQVVNRLVCFLASKKLFPYEQINRFMSQVVTGVLGTEEEGPAEPWLIIAVDEEDMALRTTVSLDRGNKYLFVSAGYSNLGQVDQETATAAIGDFIYSVTMWFTWGRKYGPTTGPRADWAESRENAWLKAVEKNPQIITQLQDYLCH